MTIAEISRQQLDAHPQLGWKPANTDMAKQRANWVRSLGLAERDGDLYRLSEAGVDFVDDAVETWAGTEQAGEGCAGAEARTYETTVQARAVDPEFRATVLGRHDATCPVSGVDHPQLLAVAHVLPWSEYPDCRADPANVLPLGKTHHAAFDRGLFTIDEEFHLRVSPAFETESRVLQQTLLHQAGESLSLSEQLVDPDYLQWHNESLEWT
ncbi:HNH endonuclease [Halorientalis marina]|uniref:HNH endonuclease n=1 Tax=Halorientalis marina TaxID=2931976 RepID=UPI001FF2C034|nr:HNH endonuclease [Halorientalis marina]